MFKITEGHCGSCLHFGEGIPREQLVQIRINNEAPDDVIGGCGHPATASLHLRVSMLGSCDGFTPLEAA